ncbi:hypothetical protein V8E36_003349 [Tilletia maclaganii]
MHPTGPELQVNPLFAEPISARCPHLPVFRARLATMKNARRKKDSLTVHSRGALVYDADGSREGKKRWKKKDSKEVVHESDLPAAGASTYIRAARMVEAAKAAQKAVDARKMQVAPQYDHNMYFGDDGDQWEDQNTGGEGSDAGSDDDEDPQLVARSSIAARGDFVFDANADQAGGRQLRRVHPSKSRFQSWHDRVEQLFDIVYDKTLDSTARFPPVSCTRTSADREGSDACPCCADKILQAADGLPPRITCACYTTPVEGTDQQLTVYGLGRPRVLPVKCCRKHLVEEIVKAGLFPATPSRPEVAFTMSLLRWFQALIDLSGIGANNMAMAVERFIRRGISFKRSRTTYDASDAFRKQLRSACTWVTVIERYATAMALRREAVWTSVRSTIEQDDLHLSLDDLVNSCPACFQSFKQAATVRIPGSEDGPQRAKQPFPPRRFLSDRQIAQAALDWEAATGTAPDGLSCIANIRAINSQGAQQSDSPYDITGVMGACCRHDIPLVFCDMRSPGERHYYAIALIRAVMQALGPKLTHLGITYDIGCRFDPSSRVEQLLAATQPETKISWSVPVFHVYGHTVSCKTKYSPRNLKGFGYTDGEGMERVWSGLSNLIGAHRNMSEGERRFSLEERLDYIAAARRLELFKSFATKDKKMQSAEREAKETLVFDACLTAIPLRFRISSSETDSGARHVSWSTEFNGIDDDVLSALARMSEDRKMTVDEIAVRRRQVKKNNLDAVTIFSEDLLRILGETQEVQKDMYDRPKTANNGYKTTARLYLSLKGEKAAARKAMDKLNKALAERDARDADGQPRKLTWDTLFDDNTFELVEGWANEGYADEDGPVMWWHNHTLKKVVVAFNTLSRIAEERQRVQHERQALASWIQDHMKELKIRASQHVVYEDALADMERLLQHWNGDGDHAWALLPAGVEPQKEDDLASEEVDEEVVEVTGLMEKLVTP